MLKEERKVRHVKNTGEKKSSGSFINRSSKNIAESFRKVWQVLKLLMNNRFSTGGKKGFAGIFTTIIKYVALFGVIGVLIWFILSRITGFLVIPFNTYLFSIILAAIFVITLISSISNIISTMYMSKDNEILLSLPISFNELFISKLIFLYINELVFNILYIAPIFVASGIVAKGGLTPMAMYTFALFFPIVPIFTLGVGAFISIPVMFVVRFFKDHTKTAAASGLVAIAALFSVYMIFITNISGAFNIANETVKASLEAIAKIKQIGSNIPIVYWLSHAFFKGAHRVGRIYLFLLGSVGILLAALPLIKSFYQKIAVFNNETKHETRVKARKYVKRSALAELFINEIRTCLRSPSLIVQYFLFTILLPLICFAYDRLLFTISVNQVGEALLIASHVLVLMMLTALSSAISSVAISRQGGLIYISKMIPISYEKQAFIKITFNVVITWIAIIIGTIVSCIFSIANDWMLIISGIAAMFFSVGHICQCYDTDLRNPTINWYDVNEISALSKNTTKCLLYGFLLAVIFTVLTALAKGNILITALVLIIPSALYAVGRLWLIKIRLKFLFDEMEI